MYHDQNLCTREEHDSRLGQSILAAENQNNIGYHAIAFAAGSEPDIDKETKSI